MTSSKLHLILEIIWIITGILCLAAGLRILIVNGFETKALIFVLMAAVSFLFAKYRDNRRKKS